MQRNLTDWKASLAALNDMLINRRKAFADRLPVVQARERSLGIEAMERKRDQLTADIAKAEEQGDGVALADARERDLLERFERVRALLAKDGLGNDPEVTALRERFRRVAGALTWQLNDAFASRLWDAKKNLKEIDTGLAEARERDGALARAQQTEPARFDQLGARIAALDSRLVAMAPRVTTLIAEQQQYIQDLAVAALEQQKERLAAYVTQARFSVAQIYDRARVAKEGSNAPPSQPQ